MQDLWSALGYGVKADAIVASLAAGAEGIVISGPPGVGKSWLAAGVGVLWDSNGGSTVLIPDAPSVIV